MGVDEAHEGGQRDPRLMRVSHADRDRVVEILRDAAADGRLDTDELEERVERALAARTFADFEPLTEDLPVAGPVPPHGRLPEPAAAKAPAVAAPDEDVVRWATHGRTLRREGAWAVPRVVELSLHGGSARLDYTLARLPEGGESTVRVSAHGGRVRLTVPPWIAVDLSGISTHGGRIRDHASRRATPGTQVTHVITVTGSTHGGSVRVEASGG